MADSRFRKRSGSVSRGNSTRKAAKFPSPATRSMGAAGPSGPRKKIGEDDNFEYYEEEVQPRRSGRSGNSDSVIVIVAAVLVVAMVAMLGVFWNKIFPKNSSARAAAASTQDIQAMKTAVQSLINAKDTDGVVQASRHVTSLIQSGKVNADSWRKEVGGLINDYLYKYDSDAHRMFRLAMDPDSEIRDAEVVEMEKNLAALKDYAYDLCERIDFVMFQEKIYPYVDQEDKSDPARNALLLERNITVKAYVNKAFVKKKQYCVNFEIQVSGSQTHHDSKRLTTTVDVLFNRTGDLFAIK